MSTRTVRIIEDTFDNPFDLTRYQAFAQELLKQFEATSFRNSGNVIPRGYHEHVALFGRIGTYIDPEDRSVDILYIKLRTRGQMVRARALQRNFVARHLKNRNKDGALVAFYVDGVDDWRLSLVWRTEEMRFDEEKERIAFDEELTPARRSSYLLGTAEPSHTAKRQLLPLLESRVNPTLAQLQSAFSVERVTREFFDQYKELYLQLHEELEKRLATDAGLRQDFNTHQINTHDFAKKLLGQIVFLYFLQKKGWLGVPRGAEWQTGSTRFLRDLFEGEHVPYSNFFNDVLEPLFYEALAIQREDDWYEHLNCRIPFLNGGLFEPMNGYDWRGTTLALPDTLFSNTQTSPAGDVGTGILDVFDRYNFTVHEEEPLEKEVAVDPEMLGKVFENLLEVTDRKSKGAFYTPREIVHYMCQESLINYLDTALNYRDEPLVPREKLADFIRHSAVVKADRDSMKAQGQLRGESYQLPEEVRTHARRLDEALAAVKICDPAIGSGAFPVGMLTEIVRARAVLREAAGLGAADFYALKHETIQNSLYGVDLDASAVEIAKLRLWLSLVVDEESYEDIQPLPNLDYKIVCGNSLIGFPKDWQSSAFTNIEKLKRQYFSETDSAKKAALKEGVDSQIQKRLANSEQVFGYKVDFDFKLFFSEVFHQNSGFDILIGNPPYVRMELFKELKPQLKNIYPSVYTGRADLYVYFYARALDLLNRHGTLAYITSNKFMRAAYGKKLRTFLTEQTTLHSIIDFGDLPVFDATAYPSIVIVRRDAPREENILTALTVDSLDIMQRLPQQIDSMAWKMPQSALVPTGWALVAPEVLALMEKLRSAGQPLEQYLEQTEFYTGIKTGLNKAFLIDAQTREHLLKSDPSSQEIIKPWLRGKDVKRWSSEPQLYVIFPHPDVVISDYPAVEKYLLEFRDQLEKRATSHLHKWYELQQPQVGIYKQFVKPKIIWPDIAKRCEFTLDYSGAFIDMTLFTISCEDEFLLAILNSRLIQWFLDHASSTIRGGFIRFKRIYMAQIPIAMISDKDRPKILYLVRNLLKAKGKGGKVAIWEQELNTLIYKLYDLTNGEIALIENSFNVASKKERIESAGQAISKLGEKK